MTHQWALRDQLYHLLGTASCLIHFTVFLTLESVLCTQKLITSPFVWPGINADVRRWTRTCIPCQRAKINKHTTAPLSSFPIPNTHFDVVHIDLVGPLPSSQGYFYFLTCVDRYTCWPEALPLRDITADTVAKAFLSGWIACFGVPSTIVANCGRQFESTLWFQLMSLLGTKRSRTTAYLLQSNGMVERFHRQLKAALKEQPKPDAWMVSLPLILLGIRTSLKPDINSTAAEMVYSTNITPSNSNSLPAHSDFITRLKTHFHSTHTAPLRCILTHSNIPEELSMATHVFVRHDAIRRPLQPPYDEPYPITKRTSKHFTININSRHNTISIDRLKPAHIDTSTNTTEYSTEQSILTSHSPTTCTHTLSDHPTLHPLRSPCQIPFLLISFRVRHWGGAM